MLGIDWDSLNSEHTYEKMQFVVVLSINNEKVIIVLKVVRKIFKKYMTHNKNIT